MDYAPPVSYEAPAHISLEWWEEEPGFKALFEFSQPLLNLETKQFLKNKPTKYFSRLYQIITNNEIIIKENNFSIFVLFELVLLIENIQNQLSNIKKNKKYLKKSTEKTTVIINIIRNNIILSIPKLCETKELPMLQNIAHYFYAGIPVSNKLMREIAAYTKNSEDLYDAVNNLHLRTKKYGSLKEYYTAEQEQNKQALHDRAIAAFLEYEEIKSVNSKKRKIILESLIADNQKKLIDNECFNNIINQAIKNNDAKFILVASISNILKSNTRRTPLSKVATLNNNPELWRAIEHEANKLKIEPKLINLSARSAAISKHDQALAALLRMNADINFKDCKEKSLVKHVKECQDRNCFVVLCSHVSSEKLQELGSFPAFVGPAIDSGDFLVLEYLNKTGYSYLEDDEKVYEKEIMTLIQLRNTRALVALHNLRYRRKKGPTVLSHALSRAEFDSYVCDELFPALIKSGANIYKETQYGTLADYIMRNERDDLLRLAREVQYKQDAIELGFSAQKIIEQNKSTWLYNNSLLLEYILKNNADAVKLIIKHKLDNINSRSHDNKTALHWAVQMGSVELVEALLQAGININLKDNNQQTAYELACCLNRLDIAKLINKNNL